MAVTIEETFQRPVGELLRGWRERRRLSQLELANRVEVSTRHVSFVETVPMKLDHQGHELSLLTTIATFGTPLGVTVSELMIESFYPADEPTADYLRTLR